jgi:hypothetical protein
VESVVGSVPGSPTGSRNPSMSPPGKKRAGSIKLKLKVSSPPALGSPLAYIQPIVATEMVYSPMRAESEKKLDE